MSGVKGRSGRKPGPDMKSRSAIFDENISPEQWKKIWAALIGAATQGNIPALRLLLEYRLASARAEPMHADKAANHIAYLLPVRDDEVLPPDAIVVKNEEELLDRTSGSPD